VALINFLMLRTSMNVGGIERQTLNTLRMLDRDKFRVHLVTFNDTGLLVPDARAAADAYEFIPRGRNPNLRLVLRLRRYVRANDIQVVQANNLAEMFYAYLATKGTKARTVGWVHRVPDPHRASLHRWALARQDCAVFVSETIRTELTTMGWRARRMETIKNGVELGEPRAPREAGAEASVCMIARFAPEKDHSTFLRAMALLPDLVPGRPIHATIVGGGDAGLMGQAESLATSLGNGVTFADAQTDVTNVLADADCLVASSLLESFSLTVLEAMATGVPAVASDIPAHRELTQDGRSGLLFPVGDAEALAKQVAFVLADPTAAARYRELGIKRAAAYDARETVLRTEDLFSSLAAPGIL
jgi:glycosyltransferase involved in cell wall biosynthesis